ncbi:MAG: tRNA (guanosine(46)-N7)-methyltransferase TrmB [Gammaproteobacteria bacterium]|nr:MAG: tRNA (guanosine(46)-N7)-methyltransferase TrmB [Gammaproteobacteria bacterium]
MSDAPPISPPSRRRVRSFVRREGRMTPAQKRALERLWPRFGLPPEGEVTAERLFGRACPLQLEIGIGTGDTLLALARHWPRDGFIGVEVHRPGLGHCLQHLEREAVGNVRLACADAVELLRERIPAQSLSRVHIYFPDPWHKKRHHKRRLIQPAFLELLADRLAGHGQVHLATDWDDYAEWIHQAIASQRSLVNLAGPGRTAPRPAWRPVSRYEARALRLGHRLHHFLLGRV